MALIHRLLHVAIYVASMIFLGTIFDSNLAFADNVGEVQAVGAKIEFFYTDGAKISEAEVNQLINEGMIPDNFTLFYGVAETSGAKFKYFTSENKPISRNLDVIDEGGKHEDDVEYADIANGASDVRILANSLDGFFTFYMGLSTLDYSSDEAYEASLEKWYKDLAAEIFPFGAMASSSFNLHSGTADTMLYVPHKLFIPEGYPALTIRGERWHDEIFYVRDDGQKEGIRTHVFEVKYDGDRPTTSLQVKKTWHGFDGEDIPSFIDVALVDADGNEVAKTRIVKESEWVSRFENLPTYKDGEKIDYSTYSVTEITAFDNVSTSINYSAEDGFTITNAKINTPPADTPHEPQDPKTPETPKAPEKPVKEIPKTADATSVSTIFSMLFLSLACMGLARYARRCEC